jgi:hypothetical protein
MERIEYAARIYADARAILNRRVLSLEAEENKLKKKHLPAIRTALVAAKEKYELLLDLVRQNKALFKRPKKQAFHGVEVGYRKQKGKIGWDDDAQVIRLIRKHFPDQESLLIITREVPSKEALQALTAADLKKIGVRVTDDEDKPFVRTTDSDIDKLVDALFKGEEKEREEGAA